MPTICGIPATAMTAPRPHMPSDSTNIYATSHWTSRCSGFAGLVGTGVVVDVGCGTGATTAMLHDFDLDVVGIDLSPNMIADARRLNLGLRFELLTGVTAWAHAKLGTRASVGRHAEYRRHFVHAHGRRGP
jgi:SAM-dependent methyltransferase